jgi:hypothetical protein
MLKLTYTETGFHLERLAQSLEEWVFSRVMLSLRVGQRLLVEPSTASFLLPADLPGQPLLQAAAELERTEAIVVCICDAESIEVSLRGTWLAADGESSEGVFVAVMSDRIEFFLFKLWQEAQACTSSLKQ